MAGWLFVDAPLEDGESLEFRRVCTLHRGRRSIGGEVNVTDRRVLFVPNRLEQLVGAKPVDLPRADVDHVRVIPPPLGSERFAFLPRTPRARAEIDGGEEVVVLQLTDAASLARLLGYEPAPDAPRSGPDGPTTSTD